jgi:membrane-associated phospholipid phosphatase
VQIALGSLLEPATDKPVDDSSSRHPVLAALAVTAVGLVATTTLTIAIGLLLTHPLEGTVGQWDWDVTGFWVDHRYDWLNAITKRATSGIGSYVRVPRASLPALIIAGVIVAVLVRKGRWREGTLLTIAFAVEFIAFRVAIHFVERNRPPFFDLSREPSTTSFPSGHTAAATVLFVGVTLIVFLSTTNRPARVATTLVCASGLFLVGFARVYRGVHSFLDVLVGVLLGLACLATGVMAVRAASRRTAPRVARSADQPAEA